MEDNAAIFRSLNERIAAQEVPGLEIVCECSAEYCTERVVITPVEFHEVRRRHGWFVVRPGHENDNEDRIVMRQPGFYVVEKWDF